MSSLWKYFTGLLASSQPIEQDILVRELALAQANAIAVEMILSCVIAGMSDEARLQVVVSLKEALGQGFKTPPIWLPPEHKKLFNDALSATLIQFVEQYDDEPSQISN